MSMVQIELDLPKSLTRRERELAQCGALEGAVLQLFHHGVISGRLAAERLGLTYYDFLERLGEQGVATSPLYDPKAVQRADKRLGRARSAKS